MNTNHGRALAALELLNHFLSASDMNPISQRGVALVEHYSDRIAELSARVRAAELKRGEATSDRAESVAERDRLANLLRHERGVRSRQAFDIEFQLSPTRDLARKVAELSLRTFTEMHKMRVRLEQAGAYWSEHNLPPLPQDANKVTTALAFAMRRDFILDRKWYRRQFLADSGVEIDDEFEHFLAVGVEAGLPPCSDFDYRWYGATYGLEAKSPPQRLLHYLSEGVFQGFDPSPTFSSLAYLAMNADVALEGFNPVVHYTQFGKREGRTAIGVEAADFMYSPEIDLRKALLEHFDEAFYLSRNPDVEESGIDPLFHYMMYGEREDRNPSPNFSTAAYYGANPDLTRHETNALLHYVTVGRFEGRSTGLDTAPEPSSPALVAEGPVETSLEDLRLIDVRELPILEEVEVANADGPLMLCLTHVRPWPRNAGNEYRTGRMLDWLQSAGFRTVVVLAPLDEEVSDEAMGEIGRRYGDVLVTERSGVVRLQSRSGRVVLDHIDGGPVRDFARVLGEPADGPTLAAERTFCHDVAIETMLGLQCVDDNIMVYVNYIWMTRWLPLLDRQHRVFIDMHDLFSSKREQVQSFGIDDSLSLSPEVEGEMLGRADAVVAINAREAAAVRALVPGQTVITAGVDFEFVAAKPAPARSKILLVVGSGNAMNRKGLRDFLRFAWPVVRAVEPEAELHVVGGVGAGLPEDMPGVRNLGRVESLEPVYASARCVINPVVAGTGLKIKTVEALANFRRVVAWPNGVDGLGGDLLDQCDVACSWPEFARLVIQNLKEADKSTAVAEMRRISPMLSAEVVYNSLAGWLGVERRAGAAIAAPAVAPAHAGSARSVSPRLAKERASARGEELNGRERPKSGPGTARKQTALTTPAATAPEAAGASRAEARKLPVKAAHPRRATAATPPVPKLAARKLETADRKPPARAAAPPRALAASHAPPSLGESRAQGGKLPPKAELSGKAAAFSPRASNPAIRQSPPIENQGAAATGAAPRVPHDSARSPKRPKAKN